ncbi:MAG: hypothetical protein NNA18_03875 [Nitrospira sp.]|nr:hypothetical protein [Nitrospira sp.]
MTNDRARSLAVVRRQLAELDALAQQTLRDLNTIAGAERVTQWRNKTAALLTETVGRQKGLVFAAIEPSPSCTNDLGEEFTALVGCYRSFLLTLASHLAQSSQPGG